MTTWQEDVQRTLASAFAAWGSVVDAWSTASFGLWASVVDWAVDEQIVAPHNATAFLLRTDRTTRLRGSFRRADDPEGAPVPDHLVTFDPPVLPATPPDSAMQVVVRIAPGPAPEEGGPLVHNAGYVGHVHDDRGRQLTTAPVYVALHVPWVPPADA